MDPDEHLNIHIELCKRIFLRLLEEGAWPWPDSQKSENLVESDDNQKIS